MTDWKPIETAPKDGTRVNLWMIDERGNDWGIRNAFWDGSAWASGMRFGMVQLGLTKTTSSVIANMIIGGLAIRSATSLDLLRLPIGCR